MSSSFDDFIAGCLSVDLEVDPKTATVFLFAGVLADPGPPVIWMSKNRLQDGLDALESVLAGRDFLIGHNIRGYDLPHLGAERPRFAKAATAHLDTLWLNPLAFPRNPYHHLVKHYHDGRLRAGHVNDPKLDARLVFGVLRNQLTGFSKQHRVSENRLDCLSLSLHSR